MASQPSACEPLVLVWHRRSFRVAVWWRATAQFSEFNLHSLTATCQRTSEKQRGGQGERRGMWRDSEKTAADWSRQTEERHEGKFPPVIERRDWQSKRGTKATLCRRRLRIIHPLRSHWKGERGNKRRDERSEGEVNSRVAERKWQRGRKKKDQGEREWAQLDSTFWVNVRKLTGLTEQCGSLQFQWIRAEDNVEVFRHLLDV